MDVPNCWIAVVAQDIAVKGIAGGFAEVGFGKAGPLERMRAGDGYAVYSPRTAWQAGESLQAFTAIGRVRSGIVFRADGGAVPGPFRVEVDYFRAAPLPIRSLVQDLTFIRNKEHWGSAFRFGFVKIPRDDFALIAAAMGCPLPIEDAQPG
jgi:hypothetical protein